MDLLAILMVFALVVFALVGGGAFWAGRRSEKSRADGAVAQRDSQIAGLEERLREAEAGERERIEKIARLEAEIKSKTEHFTERMREQGQFEERMKDAVGRLAQEALQRQGDRFKQANREEMGNLLAPLKKDIRDFKDSFETLKTETVKERENLLTQFNQLNHAALKISQDAGDLTRALKGEKQKQGAWGESVLETILQNSGLREGHEYERQRSLSGDDGERLRPDVIVHMPSSDERVIIDSKVSLVDFIEYVNADDEEIREQALQRHVQAVRRHVASLGDKGYADAARSDLDFVIMFMPIEAAFAAVVGKNLEIAEYAIKRRVIMATPTTLLLALRTIANLWRVEARNVNADEIARRGGELYDKVALFLESFEKVGERLVAARGAYDEAEKRLKSGRGNLVRQTEMLRDLGANPSKRIAETWRAPAEEDAPAPPQPPHLPQPPAE